MPGGGVALGAITSADLPRVGAFLHRNLNEQVSAESWIRAVTPPWSAGPNHGFMLTEDDRVVGAYLAIYSQQEIDAQPEAFCNLAAWCVLEEHRSQGLRLLRAMLAQRGYHFLDLSPSGNVVALNRRLRFVDLDTTTAVVPNAAHAGARLTPRGRRVRVVQDHDEIAGLLEGRDRRIFEDHRGSPAVQHLVLVRDREHCYVVVRRERRKGLPLFASLLHVGDKVLFPRVCGALFARLLRQGVLATLVEIRVTGHRPALSFSQSSPRAKMYRSATLGPDDIGYMYSELACVAW